MGFLIRVSPGGGTVWYERASAGLAPGGEHVEYMGDSNDVRDMV